MSASTKENINSSFFDGHYKHIWKQIFPEKTTVAEVDFIMEDAQLNQKSSVLDLMCGHGRHALELAKRGVQVTAIDNLADYITEIREKAANENLAIEAIQADVLDLNPGKQYDAVMCMGNSFQFFDSNELDDLLSYISKSLKKGGRFYINSWSILEIAVKSFQSNGWSRMGELLFLNECRWATQPTRIETVSIIIPESGEREEKQGVDYIYSIAEMEAMLVGANMPVKEIYSIPGKKKFVVGDPRVYFVCEKL
jgi:cyclopropane fatty-acyl-phospholipid synthase-like methyltransferase